MRRAFWLMQRSRQTPSSPEAPPQSARSLRGRVGAVQTERRWSGAEGRGGWMAALASSQPPCLQPHSGSCCSQPPCPRPHGAQHPRSAPQAPLTIRLQLSHHRLAGSGAHWDAAHGDAGDAVASQRAAGAVGLHPNLVNLWRGRQEGERRWRVGGWWEQRWQWSWDLSWSTPQHCSCA